MIPDLPAPALHHRPQHGHHRPGCESSACDRRVDRIWARHHPGPAQSFTVNGATCYAATGSPTASGAKPYVGVVASNALALGTRIRVSPSVFGRRRFVVLDRIGAGSSLDFFGPSEGDCARFGRRDVTVTVLMERP